MKRIVMLRSNPVRPYPRLEKMANSIIKMGHKVTILAWDRDKNYAPKEEEISLNEGKARIIRVGIRGVFSGGFRKNTVGLLKFEKFLYLWLKKHSTEYDIIHAYDFDCGYVASLIAKMNNKKLVYDIADYYVDSHGMKGTLIGKLVEKMEISVINKADITIICTEERKKQISKAKPQEIVVIHNTPSISNLKFNGKQIIKEPSDRLKLVYVGILGSSRFIDKIAQIVSGRKDCEFHIGGFGRLESFFDSYAKKHENIFFYGRIPYDKTIELEKECDVMCALYDPDVPNHTYAAPNKFYEALALGKPIIMAKHTGMADIIERENLGEVIDFTDNAFENAITKLIKNRKSFPEIASKAQRIYQENYSWDEMNNRIIKLYKTL